MAQVYVLKGTSQVKHARSHTERRHMSFSCGKCGKPLLDTDTVVYKQSHGRKKYYHKSCWLATFVA